MPRGSIGLDFGTTNSVVALGDEGRSELLEFDAPGARAPIFRSALCFWHDDAVKGGLASDAGSRLSALLGAVIAEDIRTEETSEVLGSLRQRDLVERARDGAAQTLAALARHDSPEYAVTHCHAALDALADLVGETTSDDVLARLFSTFCIGK